MKTILQKFLLFLCALLLANRIVAQDDISISVFYKYGYKFDLAKQHYPIGFGSSISKHFSKKYILTAGLEYSHHSHDYYNQITPATYRTEEVFKESVYVLNLGLSYPIINDRFEIRIGGSLLPSYFTSHYEFNRYLVSNDLLDLQHKDNYNFFGLGVNTKIDLVYSINQDISIFIQPGFTYYLTENVNSKFIIVSTGINFKL